MARQILIEGLGIQSSDIPLPPNKKIRKLAQDPRDYGDIDFMFIKAGVLIHIDMKSYSRSIADVRGDFLAIKARVDRLATAMRDKVEPRGAKALELVRQSRPNISATLNFLCVGVVEFVPSGVTELWYGNEPRVLIPRELVQLLSDSTRFSNVVSQASRAAPT
jgi:hypothetical protein